MVHSTPWELWFLPLPLPIQHLQANLTRGLRFLQARVAVSCSIVVASLRKLGLAGGGGDGGGDGGGQLRNQTRLTTSASITFENVELGVGAERRYLRP